MKTSWKFKTRAINLGGTAMLLVAMTQPAFAQQTTESTQTVPDAATPANDQPAAPVETGAQASTPAQTDVASNNFSGDEIVVTAQKRIQNINDVGLTVQAIGGELFQERQINSLADIAQVVPGLSFTQSGSNTPVYTLRGVGFYETTLGAYPAVSTYLDEAPLPFPVLTTLTAFDLERVEVLKGPQGTLFGNNATAGAINYIAAKPTSAFEAGGSLSYGRFNSVVADAYVSGPVSETLKVRLSGKFQHADDWQRGYTFDGETGKTETYAGRFLADWTPTDRLRVQININGWKDKSDPQAVQYIQYRPNFPGAPSPVEFYPTYTGSDNRAADFSQNVDPHSNNRLYHLIGRLDYDVTDAITLTSLTSYVNYDQDMAYDGDGVTLNDFDVPLFEGKVTSFSQEVRLASSGQQAFRWVLGANYERDKASDNYTLLYPDSTVFGGAGLQTSGYFSDQKIDNYAGFANGELDVGQFTFKAGVRYTKSNRDANSCFYVFPGPTSQPFQVLYQFLQDTLRSANGLPPAGPVSTDGCLTIDNTGLNGNPPTFIPGEFVGSLNQDNWSYKGGVDWKPNRDTLIYFNVTKGYKAGSFPSAAAATTAQLLGVVQESLLSYEGGGKFSLLDNRLQANVAGFYYDYTDKQLRSKLLDPIFGVLDALVNIPKSRVYGAELELTMRPTDGLSTYLNYVYINSKIQEFTGYSGSGVLADFSGAPFPYAPKHQVTTGFSYEFPVSEQLGAFFGADLSFRSNTTAIIGESTGPYKIDSYGLLDLRAGVVGPDDRWRFQVWGKNVTNSYYWTNVASYYDTIARYAGRPVSYGATLAFKFR